MTIAAPLRWLALLLAFCMAATATMADGSSIVMAQSAAPTSTPTLGLPAAADRGQDRLRVPAPIGPARTGSLDLGKVQDAALQAAASLPEQQWDVGELAWSTSGDSLAAFHFVRDHVRLEPYAGILRGPDGTLAARAGNSEDRALLLKSMLDSMQVRSRFAVGDLDDATAAELLAQSVAGAPAPLPDTSAVDARSLDGKAIGVRARRDYAVLQDKVGAMLHPDVDVDNAAALADLRHHVWLQIRHGTEWLDYDTTRPDAEPGQRLTAVQSTVEELPAVDYQTITVRVVTESVSDDQLVQKTSLEAVFPAWDVATSEVFLYFQPKISNLGGSILQALGEAVYWEPELMVDKVVQQGSPFQVLSGQDLFDPGASPDPLKDSPLAGVRLEVQRDIPGQPSQTFTHVILDRVPASARAAGIVTPNVLAPMDGGNAGPTALAPIIHVMASTGGSNPRDTAITQARIAEFVDALSRPDAAGAYELGDLLWPVAVADQSLVTASERIIVPALDDGSGGHAFIADARVYLTSFGPGGSSGSGIQVATDLLADGVRIIAPSGVPADGAQRRMWYGALQTALETQFVYEILSSVDPVGRQVLDVSDSTGSTLAVLAPDDPGSVPVGAAPALRDAVAAGLLAVVPGDPATSTTWWTVDPRDGTTRSIIDPGYGSIFGGGNYVNEAPPGGSHYIDDQGNRLVRKAGGPKGPCQSADEEMTLIGCVSIPAAWAFRIGVGVGILVVLYFVNKAWQWVIS
jgi:hypothetical protein